MAVDLSLVARLEEFPRNLVEIAGDHEVVQYRGEIMPLIRVSEKLVSEQRRVPELVQDSLHVVVYSEKGRSIGLVVDRILDIVEESFAHAAADQPQRNWLRGHSKTYNRHPGRSGLVAASEMAQMLGSAQG